ncbi:hypothetical protein [Actinoallomurus sp. CA-142502]|uniref:hypothetical protein n=1 Tax=Actinoallomurus sp. CA-142502 TaxID=3239885 RepID=UPI003D8B06EE
MTAGVSESAIVVEEAGSTLVLRSTDADASAVGFAAALRPESSRTTVVVDASASAALDALDPDLLWRLVDRLNAGGPGSEMRDMRLVAARSGAPDPSGASPLAARLADWLGVGVVAPDGDLIALRGGELFSAGAGAGWLAFRRGSSPQWNGPRYPAPAWQAALPREFPPRRSRAFGRLRSSAPPMSVTAIPAGLWVRAAGGAPLTPADLGYGVPVEKARPVVLVGAPGEPAPDVAELAAFLASLPSDLGKSAVIAPYGQGLDASADLVQNLVDRLGMPIHAYHALPHYAGDGTRRFALFGSTGRPDRLTDAPEWLHRPGAPRVQVTVEEPSAPPDSGPDDSTVRQDDPNVTLVDPIASEPRPYGATTDRQDDAIVLPARETPVRGPDDSVVRPSAPHRGAPAMVTVDVRGFLRPCGPTRRATMARDGGAADLPTVASTEVPEVRSAASYEQAGGPATVTSTEHVPPDTDTVSAPLPAKRVAPLQPPIAAPREKPNMSSHAVRPHEPAVTPRPSPGPVPDQPRPVQPVVARQATKIDRQWLANRVRTPEDRRAFRASLGWRYDAAARSVARLLAEQPGLRGAAEQDEALMTDLAAVRVFAGGDRAEFVASVRSGGSESDRSFAACVAAGLRRLPSFQGVVVCGGPPDPETANAYRPGQELIEAAPLTAFDAVDALVPGAVEFLIWSATARRLSGFAGNSPYAEVAFLPGTVFRVLAVDPEETAPVRRVLLADIPAGRSPKQTWLDRILARLEEAAANRADLPRETAVAGDARSVLLPGDPDGAPSVTRTNQTMT